MRRRQRSTRSLQTSRTTLTALLLDRLKSFVVAYLGDKLDEVSYGGVVVSQMKVTQEIQIQILGKCATLLSILVTHVDDMVELLSAELDMQFVETQAPFCDTDLHHSPPPLQRVSQPPPAPRRPHSTRSPPPLRSALPSATATSQRPLTPFDRALSHVPTGVGLALQNISSTATEVCTIHPAAL